tara:strand:+ start:593 stop:1213 length:621 start_codon:yes stop_codon:yes gene_type:complete
MSTIKTTNIIHGSNSGTANLVLASDGGITYAKKPALGRQILEQFFTPCDGSTIATSAGDVTVQTKADAQTLTTSYVDVAGSVISYTPPAGTTQVIYEYQFSGMRVDSTPQAHIKMFIDSDEVTDSRYTLSADHLEGVWQFKWGINIGGSAVTATGRQASWSSAKTLKLQARDYSATQDGKLNETYKHDGTTASVFFRPSIGITAIG